MGKPKGLGKGLDALFGDSSILSAMKSDGDSRALGGHDNIIRMNINSIVPGKYQPRRLFDAHDLEELSQSIKQNGVILPLVVRPLNGGNEFELIAGERRLKASKLANLDTVPVIVRSMSDKETLAVSLLENIQRKDLNAIEEALAYQKFIDEFDLTHGMIAKISSKSRSHISNLLRLLNLTQDVQNMLLDNKITMGHARAIVSLPRNMQLSVANLVHERSLTTAQTEKYIAKIIATNVDPKLVIKAPLDLDVLNFQHDLSSKLKTIVKITHHKNGKGTLSIKYSSAKELNHLFNLLKK